MRSIKAKLKKPPLSSVSSKDDWSKLDQQIWHSVVVNQPAKLASKLSKYDQINVNKLCPSVGYSVVHYAAAKGLDDCLNVLLAHKADVSTRDVTGATPLHARARYGHKGTTTKLLASRTVDVNACDHNQCTALHFASFEGHVECVKLISSEKHCNIRCVDKEGRTALMVAAAMGRLSVCQVLINRGINVNHKDSSALQHTALSLSAEAGHAEVVKLLCEKGADYDTKLNDGKTALDLAKGRGRRSVVDALHIIQLTEAAKKTDRASRLSVSSKSQSEDFVKDQPAAPRKGSRKDTYKLENGHGVWLPNPLLPAGISLDATKKLLPSLPYKDVGSSTSLHTTPEKPEEGKERDGGSSSTQRTSSTVISLYNDPKQDKLYDRDAGLYDSKSTLASVSTADASTNTEASKTKPNEYALSTKVESSEATNDTLKLAEELVKKEGQIAQLESQMAKLKINFKKEFETLKKSNSALESSVQDLEKTNNLLLNDCQALQEANQATSEEISILQNDKNDCLLKAEKNEKELQVKVTQMEKELCLATSQIHNLTCKNQEAIEQHAQEERKNEAVKIGLNRLLLDIGKPSDNTDTEECLRLLKCELLQAKETSEKELEFSQKDKIEHEKLEDKVLEQDDEIQGLKLKLNQSEKLLKKQRNDHQAFNLQTQDLEKRLQQAESVGDKQSVTINLLNQEVIELKGKLSAEKENNILEIKNLKEKLKAALLSNKKAVEESSASKLLWQRTEAALLQELEETKEKYNEAKQKVSEDFQATGLLREEKNQKEAEINALQKELEASHHKWRGTEAQSKKSEQELAEANCKCSTLQNEVDSLQKSKEGLLLKLNEVKMYQCTEVERKKIYSMKTQLEHLCKHIQESEKKYEETISVYRSHLLMAAKGELNPDVLTPLKEILKLREESNSSHNL